MKNKFSLCATASISISRAPTSNLETTTGASESILEAFPKNLRVRLYHEQPPWLLQKGLLKDEQERDSHTFSEKSSASARVANSCHSGWSISSSSQREKEMSAFCLVNVVGMRLGEWESVILPSVEQDYWGFVLRKENGPWWLHNIQNIQCPVPKESLSKRDSHPFHNPSKRFQVTIGA